MTQVADLTDLSRTADLADLVDRAAPIPAPPQLLPRLPPLLPTSAPSAKPARTDGSTPQPGPGELLELARWLAAEPGLTDRLAVSPTERTWLELPSGPGMVAWLIAWPPGTGTGWHDHGGSHGAMVTIFGELTERSTEAPADHDYSRPLALPGEKGRVRRFAASHGRSFTGRHVHEVTNDGSVTAYSVHVYGPDLTLMRRYAPSGGELLPIGAEKAGQW